MLFKLALRNIRRNGRRSVVTALAIAIGGVAIVLFGEFVSYVTAGLETNAVDKVGHLTVFHRGYFDYGAGDPAALGIAGYEQVMQLVREDPELAPKLNVVTPTVSLTGIAGNFAIEASKTFLGVGVVPADSERMRRWDEHGINTRRVWRDSGLRDDDETIGVVGVGLARVLGLCEGLKIRDCPPRPVTVADGGGAAPELGDVAALAAAERVGAVAGVPGRPRLDLLAASAAGTPNVLSLFVSQAEPQGAKELDDNYVAMHFKLAQKLLYGRGDGKAGGIMIQLRRTEDLPAARARLRALFKARGLDLEVRDFAELQPFYKQAVGMFRAIFAFNAMIMAIIVLFTVVNTTGMSVMERIGEIGTARAMGVRRSGIRRLFLMEGALLGGIGATAGVVLAQGLALLFNGARLTWTPPAQSAPVPLEVMTWHVSWLLAAAWLGLVAMATLAAVVPANRAARLQVVDALRHL